jgi:hypothetical protein
MGLSSLGPPPPISIFFFALATFFAISGVWLILGGADPPCTAYIVSDITGDTLAIEDYSGPPIEFLASVEESWTEGCDG